MAVKRNYRLKAGTHSEGNITYRAKPLAGERLNNIVPSERDLAAEEPQRFERVADDDDEREYTPPPRARHEPLPPGSVATEPAPGNAPTPQNPSPSGPQPSAAATEGVGRKSKGKDN